MKSSFDLSDAANPIEDAFDINAKRNSGVRSVRGCMWCWDSATHMDVGSQIGACLQLMKLALFIFRAWVGKDLQSTGSSFAN